MPDEVATKEAAGPKDLPESARDEVLLKLVGTGTLVVGVVLLVAGVIAISILSIMRFDIGPWLAIIPLSLLVILVGGAVNGYYRAVLDEIAHPEKARRASPASGYPYPYWYPMPSYAPNPVSLPPVNPRPAAPAPAIPAPPTGSGVPAPAPDRPDLATRFCVMCGRRIPIESRFCPYCRHAYPA